MKCKSTLTSFFPLNEHSTNHNIIINCSTTSSLTPSPTHSPTTRSHSAVFSTYFSPIKLSTTLVCPHMKTDSLTHSLARSYSLSTRMTAHTRLASHDCTPYQICSVPRAGCLQHPQFERSRIDHCSLTPTN